LDWALLEREKAPFGLTFVFTPQWRRLDDTSGAPQESFGFPIQLLADVALSPDKWFAAANLNYAPVFIHNPRTLDDEPADRNLRCHVIRDFFGYFHWWRNSPSHPRSTWVL
jgi:hypothetical protein